MVGLRERLRADPAMAKALESRRDEFGLADSGGASRKPDPRLGKKLDCSISSAPALARGRDLGISR